MVQLPLVVYPAPTHQLLSRLLNEMPTGLPVDTADALLHAIFPVVPLSTTTTLLGQLSEQDMPILASQQSADAAMPPPPELKRSASLVVRDESVSSPHARTFTKVWSTLVRLVPQVLTRSLHSAVSASSSAARTPRSPCLWPTGPTW